MDAGVGHDHAQREGDQIIEKGEWIEENQKGPRDEECLGPFPAKQPENQASGQNLKARVSQENIIGAEPDPVDKKTEDHDAESGPGSCEICVWKVLSLKPNHSRDSEGNQITMLPVLALPKHVGKMEHRDHVGAVAIGIGIPGIQKPERNQGACARNENFSRVFAGGVGRCHWRLKGLDSRDYGT